MKVRNIFGVWIVLVLAAVAHGQAAPADPVLRGQIRALGTTLRVLQITAHPGDEDGALLLYEARGQGAAVTLLTLTRGERGDNRLRIMAPTEQGLLRTMEQLASDAVYGVEQRFTRVVDFGFARTADEVFDRWAGHDAALGDMVRVIREMRPQIIVTPFDVSSADGDGQHRATATLVREAFRAAADAKRFPEQLHAGVEAWQARRLFALTHAGGYSVTFSAGATGAGERESWQQQAERALGEQHSQEGMWHAPRDAMRHYRLIDSAAGAAMAEGARDFADGVNVRLATALDGDLSTETDVDETAQVQSRLKAMSAAARAAEESAGDRANCVAQLVEYLRNLRWVEDRMLSGHAASWLRAALAEKRKEAERALLRAAGVRMQARLMANAKDDASYVLVPGEGFAVQVEVESGAGVNIRVAGMELKPEGGRWAPRREWNPGDTHAMFRGRVPSDAPFTRLHLLLDSDEDGAYRVLDEHNATRALPPASLEAVAEIEVEGEVARASVPVEAREAVAHLSANQVAGQGANQGAGAGQRTVMVAPAVSVIVEPRAHWNRRTSFAYGEIEVKVRSNLPKLQNALLSIHPPSGWRVEPEHEVLEIEGRGEEHSYRFFLIQESGGAGSFPVRAVVRWGGAVFDQGYTMVHGAEGRIEFDYRPSNGALVSANVEVPQNLEVGYVGVAGDPTPVALRDLNIRTTDLGREELMNGRLGKYWAIVVGPHAVDARDDLAEARGRLLLYAEQGGALVIEAQSDAERFARNAPVPYALELGKARVSNEASAVEMIDAHDDLFTDPNEIGSQDFRGWSEERGRCFAQRWDGHFQTLLRMGDPGQSVQEGSLIRARYGRGSVVYTGLSFYRQIQAGVPGAMRLLVNLLSSGAELHR